MWLCLLCDVWRVPARGGAMPITRNCRPGRPRRSRKGFPCWQPGKPHKAQSAETRGWAGGATAVRGSTRTLTSGHGVKLFLCQILYVVFDHWSA